MAYLTDEQLKQAITNYNGDSPMGGMAQPSASPSAAASPVKEAASPEPSNLGDNAALEQFLKTDPQYKPWYDEFVQTNGAPPKVDDPDYDYRAAIKGGIAPHPYTDASGVTSYHWASSLPNGDMLKSENHPTAWMEHFMRQTGKDPKDLGVHSMQEAFEYLGSKIPGATSASRPQNPYDAAAQAVDETSGQRMQAAQGEADARQRAAGDQRAAAGQHGRALDQSDARMAERRTSYEKERDTLRAAYGQLDQKAAAMETPHDRRSTRQKLMGGLAVGLGQLIDQNNLTAGLMQGMNVQTDNAAQTEKQVNIAVERDIQAQREALAGVRDQQHSKVNQLGMARDFFKDDAQAEEWTRAAAAERYGVAVQEIGANLQSDVARSALMDAGARIAREASDQKLKLFEQRQDMHLKQSKAGRGRPFDWGSLTPETLEALEREHKLPADGKIVLDRARAPALAARKEQEAADAKTRKDQTPDTKADIPGYQRMQDVAPGDAAAAKKITSAARSLRTDLARLGEIRARNKGGTVWNRNDVTEANQLVNGMAPKYSQMFGSGAPSTTELELFKSSLVNPTDYQFFGLDPNEAYSRAADQITRTEQAQLGAYGYVPGGQGQGQGAPAAQRSPQNPTDPMRQLKSSFGFRPKDGAQGTGARGQ